ncbi:MAG: PqqD family protein [Bacteroidales bacterium]|nr:PqqD family protein [Bacteroidales bacterium]
MKLKDNVKINDSGFIFNSTTGESFSLNPIGIEIMNLIKNGKPYNEIKKIILEKYQTEESVFEKDFEDFTGILKTFSLIDNN